MQAARVEIKDGKYQRREKKREDNLKPADNVIRITASGKRFNYISYALTLLTGEKNFQTIVLKAMGRAITNTVSVAEIIRRRVPGLHQLTEIDSSDIEDVWEPLEEGLKVVTTKRMVSSITISLSKTGLGFDKNAPGYQAPLPDDQVQPESKDGEQTDRPRRGRRGRGRGGAPRARGGRRGRGRGGRGGGQGQSSDQPDSHVSDNSHDSNTEEQHNLESSQGDHPEGAAPRGRGRRGGRRGRGRGRGSSTGTGGAHGGRGVSSQEPQDSS